MADLIEYAQMAAHVYAVASKTNEIATPSGWTELDWQADQGATGFSAGAYLKGNEIVIAYTGTNDSTDIANWFTGLGVWPYIAQVTEAVAYYQAFKAAYPDANFSFTGHSLGGGLASLMAVFFDKPATTFDEAPFQVTALSPEVLVAVNLFMTSRNIVDPVFDSYLRSGGLLALSREYNISHYAIEGEALGNFRISPTALLGSDHIVSKGECTAGAVDLHSMTLLAAALASPNFHEVMQKLPSLVSQIKDKSLFASDPKSDAKRDLLTHLLRHQLGADGIPADEMLDRFGADFYALARFSTSAANKPITQAIIGVALQHYYQQDTSQENFFLQLSGGVQFDLTKPLGDIVTSLDGIDRYAKLVEAARNMIPTDADGNYPQPEDAFNEFAADKVRWNVGIGDSGLSGSAADNAADLVVGSAQADNFAAGGGDDLLIGGGGADTLQGDGGEDILYGGAEADNLSGGEDDDKLYGGTGSDRLQGDKGDDTLVGGADADVLYGGDDDDELYGDAKEQEDKASETAGADKLYGGDGKDKLHGGDGQDALFGEEGDDTLSGNDKTDLLMGGTGSDTYIYAGKGGALDYIIDEREGGTQLGQIEYDKVTLSGGTRPKGSTQFVWKSDDGYIYKTSGDPDEAEVTLTIEGGQGGKLVVVNFKNGDLGLKLEDKEPPPGSGGGSAGEEPPAPPPPALPGSSNPPKRRDPLLLDLAGTGIATVGLAAGLHFDHDGDGMKEATGWAGLGTGMLMLDRDGSGHLSNGSELFGDFTPVNGGIAVNGFLALAQYDRDRDGRIDASDPIWSQLKVWRHIADPLSGEAVIDDPDHAGELVGLDALGIVAIRLDAQGEASLDANGNTRLRTAVIELADGTTREIAEYSLARDAGDSTPQTLLYVDADIRALPELAAMGTVHGLRQAMQRDAELASLVRQFAAATDATQLDGLFTQLVYRWAGVDALAADARGPELDARKVAALEAYYGVELGRPNADDAVPWDLTWRRLAEGFRASLMAQTHLAGAMAHVPLTTDGNGHVNGGDPSQAIEYFAGRFAADPTGARIELAEFARTMRGYGLGTSVEYLRLREAMIGIDAGLDWAMDSAGRGATITDDTYWLPHGGGTHFTEAIVALHPRPIGRDGVINAFNGDDTMYGRDIAGDATVGDHLIQEDGESILLGRAGDDSLFAGAGNDVLDGGTGNDRLSGDAGDDVYIFRRGGGDDTIVERSWQFATDRNLIFLAGFAPDEVLIRRRGSALILEMPASGDRLTVEHFTDETGSASFGDIVFADGTAWDLAEILHRAQWGTEGNDALSGYMADESIDGLGGDDWIAGGDGNDSLRGGDGADELVGGNGDDRLEGGSGNDRLNGNAGSDRLEGADGNDRLGGGDGDDWLDGGSGDDDLIGGNGLDTLRGGAGDDRIRGGDEGGRDVAPLGDTILFGLGDGNDTVVAGRNVHGADTLLLGEGIAPADVELGRNSGSLFVRFASGDSVTLSNWFYGGDGVGRIVFADGTVWGRDVMAAAPFVGTESSDIQSGGSGDDRLFGLGGDDRLSGNGGNDVLDGASGDDALAGGEGNDTLAGGAGDDLLAGGDGHDASKPARANGDDTYLFGRGDGHDIVVDRDATPGNLDTLLLGAGLTPDDITLSNRQGDLVVAISDTGESVTVRGWYKGDEWQVERIVFADGTVWDAAAIRDRTRLEGTPAGDYLRGTAAAEMLLGHGADDVLLGGGGADVLAGGAGDDLLLGGAGEDNAANRDWIVAGNGDDTYVFGRGDGDDSVVDYDPTAGNRDTVRLGDGIAAADVSLRRRGADLALILDSGETLTMRDWFVSERGVDVGCRIEQIAFADGTVWNEADMMAQLGRGGAGDDELYGWEDSDTLAGAGGKDLLAGGAGDDVYRFGFGDGQDTLLETDPAAGHDILELAADVMPDDARLRRDAHDNLLLILGGGADVLTILNWFRDEDDGRRIEEIRFADGTVWGDGQIRARALLGGEEAETLLGYASGDLIIGAGGDDQLAGGEGDDTYRYGPGDGWDFIQDGSGVDAIELEAGIAPDDVTFSVEGHDLLIAIGDGGMRIGDYFFGGRIERLSFADGTVWSDATIQSMIPPSSDDSYLYGTPGDDVLVGGAGSQEVHGLEGTDRLEGGAGDDMLVGGQGADILLGGSGTDVLDAGGNVSEELGGDGQDFDADVVDGGPGDDEVFIGGRDTVVIGRGGGFDLIHTDVSRQPRLPGFREQALAELNALAALGDTDWWSSDYWMSHRSSTVYWEIPGDIESVLQSMDGSVPVADARAALSGLLEWLANDQTVRFGPGIRPEDLSVQFDAIDPGSTENPNTVRLAIGIGGGDGVLVAFDWYPSFDVSVESWPTVAEGAVKRFVFDDGGEMTLEEVLALADGGVIGDRWGDESDEDFSGSVLAEEIQGEDGNDRIAAKAGDDIVAGGDGDDVIAGGGGDDVVESGPGEDVVAFNRGDGDDRLEADWDEGRDVLSFGVGILPGDVAVRLDSNGELVFLVDGGEGGSLTMNCFDPYDWPPADVPPLARVQFVGADGTVRVFDFPGFFVAGLPALLTGTSPTFAQAAEWEIAAAPAGGDWAVAYAQTGDLFGAAYYADGNRPGDGDDRLAAGDGGAAIDAGTGDDAVRGGNGDDALSGGAGNDLIEGGAGADVVDGGAGDDVLRGGGGDDELSGGGGMDRAEGGAGADTYRFGLGDGTLEVRETAGMGAENVLAFGAGIAAADLSLSCTDGVLTIAVAGGGERVRLLDFDPAWPESAAVGRIAFADGTEMAFADLLARGFDIEGTSGDDLLAGGAHGDRVSGGEGDDLIVGGAGDDLLAGGEGDDVYVFNPGDGHDTIDDAGAAAMGDTLRFGAGIAAADLAFEFAAGGLNIRIGDDSVRILGISGPAAVGDGPLRRLAFADGSVLRLDELFGGGQPVIEGTPGNDTLQGGDAGARFVPLAGDDQMAGGLGDDTYVVAAGGGIDSIRDIARQGAGNTLVFDMAAALAGEVRLSHDALAGTLDLSVPGAGTVVRLEDFDRDDPLGVHAVERFQLGGDGPTVTYAELLARGFDIAGGDGDDELLGTRVTDRIDGGAGDDRIESGPGDDFVAGGAGDDTYVFNRGDGILTIDDAAGPGEGNVLRFGAGIERSELARALRFVAPGADGRGQLIVRLGEGGDEIRLLGFDPADPEFGVHAVEGFVFADGSSMTYRELLRETFVVQGDETANGLGGTGLGDRLYGYEADDTLDAAAGDDVLTGGTGSDMLRGGAGRDAYVFNPGDGIDTIEDAAEAGVGNIVAFGEGIAAGDLSFRLDGGMLVVRYGEGDEVRILNYSPAAPVVDTLEFADGSVMALAALLNRAPALAEQAGSGEFAEDEAGEHTLPAGLFVDPEGAALGLSASLADGTPLPSWLAFDAATGKFSGTPENVDVGSLPVRVVAVDPFGAAAAAEFALVVTNTNDAPVATLSLADVQAGEDAPFALSLPAGLFVDEDRDDRLAHAATLADGSPLPAWLAFDPTTLAFGGTPDNADVGTLAVRIVATDLAGASSETEFALTVTNANDAPQIGASLADAAAVEDAAFLYQLPAGAFADVDADDALSLSATLADGAPLPSWLAFDPYAGAFHGMPDDGDVGELSVRVTATDRSGASVAQTFALTVSGVNDAPVAGADGFAIDEDGALAVDASTLLANDSDPDGAADALRLTAVGNASHGTVVIDDLGGIVFTPDANYHGPAGFDYTVADGEGATAMATVGVDVAPVNDAPVAVVPLADQAAKTSSAFTYALPAGAFADVDAGDALVLGASLADGASLPAWLGFDAATGTFSGTPGSGDAGAFSIRVTATDTAGAAASQEFSLAVNGGNMPPVVVADAAWVAEDRRLVAAGNVLANDSDPEGSRLVLINPGIRRTDHGLLFLQRNGDYLYLLNDFSPAVQALGEGDSLHEVFSYQASDGVGTTSGELAVTISGTNDRPFLWPPIADRTIASGAQSSWNVAGSFHDMDRNDALSYSARLAGGGALPDWLSFDPATGTFSGSAPAGARGSLDIKVIATDGHGPDSTVSDVFRLNYGRKNNREGDFGEAWTQMSQRLDEHLQDRGGLLGGEAGGDTSCASVFDGDMFAMLSSSATPGYFRPRQDAREMLAKLG